MSSDATPGSFWAEREAHLVTERRRVAAEEALDVMHERADRYEAALRKIADHKCALPMVPPADCRCRTCIARRALDGEA